MDSGFQYDLTRELRRRAIDGSWGPMDSSRAAKITEALAAGQRILFVPDDEELYVETPMDRILHDASTGRSIGARRL